AILWCWICVSRGRPCWPIGWARNPSRWRRRWRLGWAISSKAWKRATTTKSRNGARSSASRKRNEADDLATSLLERQVHSRQDACPHFGHGAFDHRPRRQAVAAVALLGRNHRVSVASAANRLWAMPGVSGPPRAWIAS